MSGSFVIWLMKVWVLFLIVGVVLFGYCCVIGFDEFGWLLYIKFEVCW